VSEPVEIGPITAKLTFGKFIIYSFVVSRRPIDLVITASGHATQILRILIGSYSNFPRIVLYF
jgi:hypothetical protein